jgi:protein gp37
MNKTGIEYLTHSWNFQTGCLNQGNGVCNLPCWAKRVAHQYKRSFAPMLHVEKLGEPIRGPREKGRRIGVCFTGDLFGDWVNPEQEGLPGLELRGDVFNLIRLCPDDQFFFLTKCVWNIKKWGKFPDNAWVGVTCLNAEQVWLAIEALKQVDAKHKWLSLEPLQGDIFAPTWELNCHFTGIDWIVVGAQSQPTVLPEMDWVRKILVEAGRHGVPVWIKNNLLNHKDNDLRLLEMRQELPA